ncbi:multicopper oxidase [Virgisporangium aliadipatigenens]|uniref:Multicopper oxidase n=1 Tax=Virgisporangium aliadipatigenens TaxID=741659 RepID=A0A8J3YR72_9ACTN|nr:multicopper oxidase domain-containing protein [Virgisporangium aliadipatigenens]GIJ48997.1 multicopper oxidase [Virgisporangium aliadipatigenens]
MRNTAVRRVLVTLAVLGVLCCGAGTAAVTWLWSAKSVSTVGNVAFGNRLAIPPLAASTVDAEGRRVFDLRAGAGSHDFGRGAAPTWGFNGSYLGPTLRATRGEKVLVNVSNALAEETSVHWHGMHLPAAMDGGPHQSIAPGGTWSPTWTVNQPAATLWYHPHPHGTTAEHVYRGLAGMFIVDDPATSVGALPHEYGVDDIPVIVQDKRLDGDGRLDESNPAFSGAGILGGTIAVNGTVDPFLDVTTERVRLRLLNGSNVRSYDFGFADDRRFALVGTDGGLLSAPHGTNRIMLSPGERAEIVVTVRAGERAILRSTPPKLGLGGIADRFNGGADSFDILELRAAPTLAARPQVPARLVDVPRLDPATAAQRRTFTLSGHSINGRKMEHERVDAAVLKDSVEVWKVTSNDGEPHSFHVHDVQFQVSTMDGKAPPPQLAGWKDTIYLTPGVRFEIIARFADYADPATPYMFHCHTLYHEDRGMMGQFVVVEKGQQPAVRHSGHN